MTKYKTNNFYIFDYILSLVFVSIIIAVLLYFLHENKELLIGGASLLTLLFFLLLRLFRKLVKIEFYDKKIMVRYHLGRKEEEIKYTDISEIAHITGYNVSSINTINYTQEGQLRKLKVRAVVKISEYMDFAHWMKRKNDKIAFKFYPADSELKKLYEEKSKASY
ncbi:hypothetical protein [Marinifilum caeruleilacunae]|uniref:PH domain-containing protein n=1 Tax=Marinifilum caeruleilacunae TaxID=2499076 RepID=A0ABX1WUF3_9BACT|nr:hypothetical protein [Marinifilum caeruleilacunae]NOU59661.1 hypothetical protein [Marinifilum caeruleilacunae]